MEKTLPRQFFDRIYGEESSTTASLDTSHHAERLHNSSSNSSSEMQMQFGGSTSSSVPIKSSPYMNGFASFLARRRRKEGRPRRQRTTFSGAQTIKLEHEFLTNEYISRGRRYELAEVLKLSEAQIKIWFQNRRAKDKRIEKAQIDQQYRFMMTKFIPPVPTAGNNLYPSSYHHHQPPPSFDERTSRCPNFIF